MGTPEEKARTLADQRIADIASASEARRDKELEQAIKNAVRDSRVDMELAESKARLDRMNGSVDRFNAALHIQDKRMETMEKAFGEFTAVATALTNKGLSNRTFIWGVLAVVLPLIAILVTGGTFK